MAASGHEPAPPAPSLACSKVSARSPRTVLTASLSPALEDRPRATLYRRLSKAAPKAIPYEILASNVAGPSEGTPASKARFVTGVGGGIVRAAALTALRYEDRVVAACGEPTPTAASTVAMPRVGRPPSCKRSRRACIRVARTSWPGCSRRSLTSRGSPAYAKDGKRVSVIDGDESNFGLAQMLGKEQPKEYIDEMGGKMNMMPVLAEAPAHIPNFFKSLWSMDTLLEDTSPAPGEVKVMTVGKIHTDNEGCACIFTAIFMQIIENLRLTENDVTIIDMEVGIEHFGRGTDNAVDAVLIGYRPNRRVHQACPCGHERTLSAAVFARCRRGKRASGIAVWVKKRPE